MSIIQTIRDRAAWIITGAIALALIAFIVQDSFHSSNMFSGQPTTMGVVNGKKIEAVQFEERYPYNLRKDINARKISTARLVIH